MQAGAGRAELVFPDGFFPAEGFVRMADALAARVLILDGGCRLAVLSLELTSLSEQEVALLKTLLEKATGTPQAQCCVCVTHTFSAPHFLPDALLQTEADRARQQQLRDTVHRAARQAAAQALRTLDVAAIAIGQGHSPISVNRDVETPDGWWVGNSGTGPCDQTLTVLRADRDGTPAAILLHYAVQPSVLDGAQMADGGKVVSGDLAGIACAALERRYPGAVALFLLGAAGDQAPVEKAKTLVREADGFREADAGEHGLAMRRRLGERLAQDAAALLDTLQPAPCEAPILCAEEMAILPGKRMQRDIRQLTPSRTHVYEPDADREIPIEACCCGDVAVVGVRPELNCCTAAQIRAQSPFAVTLVATMVNGGAKYLPDAEAYDRIAYQAMNSPFGKGAAEQLARQAAALLGTLRTKQTNKEDRHEAGISILDPANP